MMTQGTRGGLTVTVRGPLADPHDRSALDGLREALTRAIDIGERHFVLDLTAVPHVDSGALGLFVDVLRQVHGEGGTVRVVGACLSVRRAFEITCLSRVFGMAAPADRRKPCVAKNFRRLRFSCGLHYSSIE